MKNRIILVTIFTIIFVSIFTYCAKYEANKDIDRTQIETYSLRSDYAGETVEIGSFSTGEAVLSISDDMCSDLLEWIGENDDEVFDDDEDNLIITFDESYIDDPKISNDTCIAIWVLKGYKEDNSSYVIMIELDKDLDNERYLANGIFYTWKCTGSNCTSCKGIRDHWWGKVTGCDCLEPVEGAQNPHCAHTTGSGSGLGSIIAALIGLGAAAL